MGGVVNVPVAAFLALLAALCTDAPMPLQKGERLVSTRADEEAIKRAVERFWEAFEAKDLDALVSLFTTDAVIMIPGHPAIEGLESIRKHYEPAFSDEWAWNVHMSSDIKKVVITDGWAFCYIHYTGVSKDGEKEIVANSKALRIYRKQPDGEWKLAYDIFNRDSPTQSE